MNLKTWLDQNKISNTEIAKKLGVDPSYISHIVSNRRRVSPEIALKIEEITESEVTRMELLYPDQSIKKPAQRAF